MKNFTHITNLFSIPDDVFIRLGGTRNAGDSTWTCPVCGEIEPIALTNGYMRAKCACEQRAEEETRLQGIVQEQHMLALEKRRISCEKCYNWLPTENVKDMQDIWDWSNFREIRYLAVYREVRRYVDLASQDDLEWTNYLVIGTVGTGKTRLMVTALNELSRKLIKCRFLTGNALFETISRCIASHEDYTRYLDEMTSCDVLLIDDLDKIYIRGNNEEGFQIKTLYSIINQRYLNRKPTWVTSNSPDIAAYVGGPAFDRLQESGVMLAMDGPSFRRSAFKVIK